VCLFTVSEAGQLPHHSSELEVVSSVAVAADLCRIVVALKVIFVFFYFIMVFVFPTQIKEPSWLWAVFF
jgi:membrane protein YdbS with pleckstrin-like domain